MSLYDEFTERANATKIGKLFNEYLNTNMIRLLSNYMNGDSKILEIGPGMGYFAQTCRNFGYEYYGVEPNKKLCQLLAARKFRMECSVVPPLPFKEIVFDLVYCSHVLEHMTDHLKAYDFIAEAHRVLKDGGYFVLLYPDIKYWKYDFWDCDYTHHFVLTERRVFQICIDNDFQVIQTFRYCGPFIGAKRYIYKIIGFVYPYKILERTIGKWIGKRFNKESLYKTKVGFHTNSGVIVRK